MLKKLEDDGATFEHTPLFGIPEEQKVALDSLKQWKHTKKECPMLCPSQLTLERLPHNFELVAKEGAKMKVNNLLMEAYMANKLPNDLLGFTSHPSNLVLLKKVKKKEKKLFPLGTCTLVQQGL